MGKPHFKIAVFIIFILLTIHAQNSYAQDIIKVDSVYNETLNKVSILFWNAFSVNGVSIGCNLESKLQTKDRIPYLMTVRYLALYHNYRQENDRSLVFAIYGLDFIGKHIKELLRVDNVDRQNVASKIIPAIDDCVGIILSSPYHLQGTDHPSKKIYDGILSTKNLLLKSEITYNDMAKNISEEDIDIITTYYDVDLTNKDANIEYSKIASVGDFLSFLNIDWYDVQTSVTQIDVAIEFVKSSTDNNYYCLVLRQLDYAPIVIKLATSAELESLINISQKITDNKTHNNEYYQRGYNLIWNKLEPYFGDVENVFFSPAGLLHQMNIEVFQDVNGKRANEKWNLHRVSSTRELCMEKPEIDMTSAVLYGNLLYDVDSTTMVAQSRAYRRADSHTPTRGFVMDSTMRAGWNKLPATSSEISTIRSTMQTNGIETAVYTLDEGIEESFKALSGKKTPIIHIATHGFFYKDEETKGKAFFETLSMSHNNQPDNSLKRSGLILAGAQKAWLGEPIPDDVEDGILLAEEIATMDLTGTDLVVLSACETGLGEITSEGVFGLQRAFKKAGVQTLIMSLWTVEDEATSLFMREFYKQWLGGKSRHDAFIATQKFMQNKYADPYYWAGFIMLD